MPPQDVIPKDAVLSFVSAVNLLRLTGKINKAALVAYQEITQDAFLAAQVEQVGVIPFVDSEHRIIEARCKRSERYFGTQALVYEPIAKIITIACSGRSTAQPAIEKECWLAEEDGGKKK
jgi:hypothetical protein